MKFIQNKNNLRLNYLYKLKDHAPSGYVINITKLDHESLHFDILEDRSGPSNNKDYLKYSYISKYLETHEDFNEDQYATYEIGHKDEYPEYFL